MFQLFAKQGGNAALFDPSVSLEYIALFVTYLHSFNDRHFGHISLLALLLATCSSKTASTRAQMYAIDPFHSRARSNNKSYNANHARFEAQFLHIELWQKKKKREKKSMLIRRCCIRMIMIVMSNVVLKMFGDTSAMPL